MSAFAERKATEVEKTRRELWGWEHEYDFIYTYTSRLFTRRRRASDDRSKNFLEPDEISIMFFEIHHAAARCAADG